MKTLRTSLRGVAIYFLLAIPACYAADAIDPDRMRDRVEELLFTGKLQVDGATIAVGTPLAELYARRDFAAVWTPETIDAWLEWLPSIEVEGLRPDDYHLTALRTLRADGSREDLDILLTASLLHAANDLRFGRVDPRSLDPSWNLARASESDSDAVATLEAALASGSPGRYLDELLPRPQLYRDLQAVLQRYREIAANGGWPSVARGQTLRLGDADPRVAVVRERLAITDDYRAAVPAMNPALFDRDLEQAVRLFQERHGLDVDGAVGPATLAALNVPVEARIDQIRLNLERGRWVFGNLAPRFLVVNIASFQVFLVEDDVPIWSARTQVGRFYRQTPTFRGELEYLVLNPTWTIPPTILREDIVPRAKADPNYLQNMQIDVRTADGRAIDPRTLDWSQLTPRNFPYVLEQRAGPQNLLGRLKFIFPNQHFVFLHDTPNQAAFGSALRTFSSGCIRVEGAVSLAELVLAHTGQWPRARIESEIATGRTQTVRLKEPLPVLVLYWTASVDSRGRARFLPDIYKRDLRVLAALEARSLDTARPR